MLVVEVISCMFLRKNLPVNQKRPVNLDLGTLKFPIMAIVSILHRLSGVVLFLLLPLMLYLLAMSLGGAESFVKAHTLLSNVYFKLALWAFTAAFVYHLLAGIRHLIMDTGVGDELTSGRRSAELVIALAIILTILLGIWIWFLM
jgi:succinate dehydrogenase / fumarate reductase, cytochrome b subunit